MISFEAARAKVIEVLTARVCAPERETLDLSLAPAAALGRVLAENIVADRNYPPFNRSIRDGFALRSADATEPGAKLRLIAESRAGVAFNGTVGAGECVRILTGAPVPRGANAVVMHEFTREEGDFVVFEQAAAAWLRRARPRGGSGPLPDGSQSSPTRGDSFHWRRACPR
jgi:molybdopterin molybdotransferase